VDNVLSVYVSEWQSMLHLAHEIFGFRSTQWSGYVQPWSSDHKKGVQVATAQVISLIYWLAILAGLVYWVGVWIRCRVSPGYAARRELRSKAKSDRWWKKRQDRRAAREGRLREWAEAHPDDEAAKAVLAEQASASLLSVPTATADQDLAVVLRARQREADDMTSRIEARRLAEEMLSQQLLEWAMANPSSPEARRHLEEALVSASKRIEAADCDVRIARFVTSEDDSPEAIDAATRIADAEARRSAAARTIEGIQRILQTVSSESSAGEVG
jgi:hypothetical protein